METFINTQDTLINNGLVLLPFLVGTTFLLVGFLMKKRPPKTINHLYGYRTKRSMKDQKTWDFAQQYSAKEMIQAGLYLLAVSIIGWFIHLPEMVTYPLGISIMVVLMILMFVRTEKALKEIEKKSD